ncbi:MAG: thioredoxin domain-containing protein [Deltaproteobacteria bacterium]|nr:thioredoxin domain-containing protein [Deltaproteobacteria bacterium]
MRTRIHQSVLISFLFAACFHVSAASVKGEPLAEVGGVVITSEEVEKSLAGQLSKLEEQIYNLKRQRIDALINDKLLEKEAAKRGISSTALLDTEVTSKVGLVTEQEIESFYQAHKAQIKGDDPKVRGQIRSHLQNQKLQARRDAFLETLRSQAKVVIHLKAPPVFRADIKLDGAPFKGGKNAPVTIVEFTDVHCPFCQKVLPTLTQILSRYGDKVKLVYKDFPIDSLLPNARKGHEAARCAHDQGKFWPYHDKLFAASPKASPEDLKTYAKEVGLDLSAFDKCFSSGKHVKAVQDDIEEGTRVGVTGTPAFFINGRQITGAQPLETFAKMIDDELGRMKK